MTFQYSHLLRLGVSKAKVVKVGCSGRAHEEAKRGFDNTDGCFFTLTILDVLCWCIEPLTQKRLFNTLTQLHTS